MSARTILKHVYENGGMTEYQYERIDRVLKERERPHGEWVDESQDALKCSVCGKWVYKPFIGGFPTERTQHYNPNYCAFCGADMRKEGGDK